MFKEKYKWFWLVIALFLFVPIVHAEPKSVDGNLNFLYGTKTLKTSDWDPMEKQDQMGIMFDLGVENQPWFFGLDYFRSESDKEHALFLGGYSAPVLIEVSGETSEIAIGFRMYPNISSLIKPYWGAGFSIFDAYINTAFGELNGSGKGGWVGAGLLFRPIVGINLGLNARYSNGDVDLGSGSTIDAGGTSVGLVVGTYF